MVNSLKTASRVSLKDFLSHYPKGNLQTCITQLNSEYFSICQSVSTGKISLCWCHPLQSHPFGLQQYIFTLVFMKAFVDFDEDGVGHKKHNMSSILISHSLFLSPAVSHISVELFLWEQHVFGDNRPSMETFEPSGSSVCMSQCPRGVVELICFHVTLSVCYTDIALLPWSLTLGKKNI